MPARQQHKVMHVYFVEIEWRAFLVYFEVFRNGLRVRLEHGDPRVSRQGSQQILVHCAMAKRRHGVEAELQGLQLFSARLEHRTVGLELELEHVERLFVPFGDEEVVFFDTNDVV